MCVCVCVNATISSLSFRRVSSLVLSIAKWNQIERTLASRAHLDDIKLFATFENENAATTISVIDSPVVIL